MNLTGAQILIKKLIEHNVKVIFEFPGGSVCSVLDELRKVKKIKKFTFRHEQAAMHAADAYARITKSASVCLATSGPGASNLVTGIANAFMDSVPVVVVTGQVAVWDLKKDLPVRQRGFQELDIVSVVKSITKKAFLVNKVSDIASTIDKAFFIAQEGRPGPVLVDIPINIQYTSCKTKTKLSKASRKDKKYNCADSVVKDIAKRLALSKKPLILAGGGVILSSAAKQLSSLLSQHKLVVAETLMGLTSVNSNYDLNIGLIGYAGSRVSKTVVKEADFVLGLGLRFDNRAFPKRNKEFHSKSYIIHVDCDRNEFNHRVVADRVVLSDVKLFLDKLLIELSKYNFELKKDWIDYVLALKRKHGFCSVKEKSKLTPKFILNRLSELTKNKKIIITTDVGQHQLWTAQYFMFNQPNSLVTSGGLGTMGFGLPAAIGAQIANSKYSVFLISSDGSFQMNIQELATIRDYKLPIKVILLNNRCLGLVRQIQEFAFSKRYESTMVNAEVDFVKISLAYGIKAFAVKKASKVQEALRRLVSSRESIVVDFRINEFENVYPVIIKGKIIDDNEES